MTHAVRSPGSALKPFIYALAFENGLAHPETMLDDRPSRFGLYAPENFDLVLPGHGDGAPRAAAVAQRARRRAAAETSARHGSWPACTMPARTIVVPSEAPPGLAVALGGLGIRLTDLARLYAGLARGGGMPPCPGPRAQQRDAAALVGAGRRIAEPVAAWYVFDMLRGSPPPPNAPAGRIAYKTGTSYGYRDAWAVGFDRRITDRRLGRPAGRRRRAGPGRPAGRGADPLRRLRPTTAASRSRSRAPPNALFATTATLPPPLRRLRRDGAADHRGGVGRDACRIAFPPDGARVDLGLGRPAAAGLARSR